MLLPDPRRSSSRSAAVLTSGLVREFGSKAAVDGVDLAVRTGEIYGFLGPNGAGKTTVIRMLCTLLRPSGGRAVVAGYDVVERPQEVRLRIGVALQEAALDDRQSGRELLALQGRLYGLRPGEVRRRMGEVLDLVAIGDAIDRRIGTYSGGMKRRLDLAAALVHNPEVLFLDEPTTGLDPESRARVWAEVRRLNRELGITIFLTTQYLEEADVLAERVGIISQGRLVAEGSPEQLKRTVGHDLIVADVEGDDPGVLDRLRQMEGVSGVTTERGTLSVTSPDAAAALSAVATELEHSRFRVRSHRAADADPRRRLHGDDRITHRRGGGQRVTTIVVDEIRAREAGFLRDLCTVAGRALRQIPREPTAVLPAVFVPAFFYMTNIGALQNLAQGSLQFSYKAFLLPMAIAFAVTGMSRAPILVTDIQSGYFDRLCMTPIHRVALLLGLMVADVVVIVALCVPVLLIGFAVGVRFASGAPGVLAFVGFSAIWGLVFTGFPYAVALKTASPAAVNASFVVFFPLFFLSDAIAPKQALTGWFSAIATYNPVTYLLGALRSLIATGWQASALLEGLAALAGIGAVSMTLALLALRGRVKQAG